MPESGAIERVRDAMDTWLHGGLPADFDRLRADLRHILDCIPETHQRFTAHPGFTTSPMLMTGWWRHACDTCPWATEADGWATPPGHTQPLIGVLTAHRETHE